MKINKSNLLDACWHQLKTKEWANNQREAGRIASLCLSLIQKEVLNTNKTQTQIDKLAEEFICDHNAIPTFKNYKNFPGSVCISVNKELVHGIPKNIPFNEGDIISLDLGATYKGSIADTAITFIKGKSLSDKHDKLIQCTQESLYESIKKIHPNNKLGIIGNTIYKYGKRNDFGVIENYGGHHIGINFPHDSPFVPNRSEPSEGIHFYENQTFAIEPMFVIGSNRTYNSKDGWTVMCDDVSAHFEHTIYVHKNHLEIITKRQDEDIDRFIYFGER